MTRPVPPRYKPVVHKTTALYRGKSYRFVREEISLPAGGRVEIGFVRHPGSTAIVPLFEDGSVALTLQYRHPVGEYILEIPAGTMEPGESPETCARREVEEEIGWRAGELQALGGVHVLPSYSDEVIHIYVARQLTRTAQNLDEDELIQVVRYPFKAVMEMIAEGQITDAVSIMALQQVWMKQ